MTCIHRVVGAWLVVATCVWGLGCGGDTGSKPKAGGSAGGSHEHGHDHGHDHDHAHHGPHGGHIIEIGDEEYHAEWTHEDDGKITVYLLDSKMKKEVPIADETIAIEVKIGDNEPKVVNLTAFNRTEGESPVASQFEVTDKVLLGFLETLKGGGVSATLKVKIGDKDYSAPITHEEHAHKH